MTDTRSLRLGLVAALASVAMGAAACSGGSTATDEAGTGGTTANESEEGAGTTSASEAAPAETIPAEVEDLPGLPMANGIEIEQATPKSGGGARPMLEWSAVDGAESYTVVLYDAGGAPWWSWSGPENAVVIGGVDTDAQIGGPQANEGARWTVTAFDPEGNMVGASPRRSIEP